MDRGIGGCEPGMKGVSWLLREMRRRYGAVRRKVLRENRARTTISMHCLVEISDGKRYQKLVSMSGLTARIHIRRVGLGNHHKSKHNKGSRRLNFRHVSLTELCIQIRKLPDKCLDVYSSAEELLFAIE
jgi:hypothetical protein